MLLSRFFNGVGASGHPTGPRAGQSSLARPGLAQMRGATHNRRTNIGRQIRLAWPAQARSAWA